MSVAVVIPTCRPDRIAAFHAAWREQFERYACDVLVVRDDTPDGEVWKDGEVVSNAEHALGDDVDIVPRQSPACRCIGFAYIARHMPEVDVVVTLDDDVEPLGDTIGDHLAALERRVPVSWMSSTLDGSPYMRGFPYGVRSEAPVWVSHGVWHGIPDLDAPTQLVAGPTPAVSYYRGPVPKGIYFPVCGMNLAFVREALPLMYWAPARRLPGAERFDDIWMGIPLVRGLEAAGAALVTGYAACVHTRLSNVFKNLEQEARGIGINEGYWRHDPMPEDVASFFWDYGTARSRWKALVSP